jgi:predicted phage-related endonuclease
MVKKSKSIILENFLNKYKDLPKQGSLEWLNQRKYTVGGSQISTIMGINKYENLRSFVKTKMDFYSFKKEAPLWFGNLMEPCIEQFVEIEYNTKTYETGSLPCSFNKYLSYSPDGLCIMSKEILKKKQFNSSIDITEYLDDSEEHIVLLEFKSPFARKIKHGEIPEYYLPQPLLGMELIDIAEMSIFIECVFRFCSFEDLYNNKYSYYHYDKERYDKKAIMYSAISLFYENENKEINELNNLIDTFKKDRFGYRYKNGDLSFISDRTIINKILELSTDKEKQILNPVYHTVYSNREQDYSDNNLYKFNMYNNPDKFVNELKSIRQREESAGKIYLGTLCYKLLDFNQIPIKKQSLLSKDLVDKIEKTFDIVRETVEEIQNKEIKDLNSFEKEWKIISKKIPTKL